MRIRTWIAPVLLAAHCLDASAAAKPVQLHGVVVDGEGKPVAGANVTVSLDGLVITQSVTGPGGSFVFQGVPREYKVAISAAGYASLESSPIPFTARGVSHFTLTQPGDLVARANPYSLHATSLARWEYGALVQGGFGTEDRSDFRFLLLGGHAGRVLTPNLGSGLLQGNFEYAVEVFPLWQSYTPHFQKVSCSGAVPVEGATAACSAPYTVGGTFTGVSVTPIMLRWNLTHGQHWVPWLQGAGGVVWTNHKYPAIGNTNPADLASNGPGGDTSVWNFTPQFGIGTHVFLQPRHSVDFSANAVHISSASLGDKNPGVNASVQLSVGYTWWR